MWRGWGLTLALALALSGAARATDDDVLQELQRERMRRVQNIRAREGKYEPVLEVGVPATAARFTNQTLTCAYRGGEGVARLEWLLDGAPFFHYNPFRNAQVSTVFNTNVEVIREASTPQRLVLREVDVTAAGVYTCQVLLAASGRLLSDSAEMVVEGVQEPERARPPPLRIESYGVVAATAGEEAALGCRVFPSESATVSWKRLRDQKLLSTNNYSYTGERRARVRHEEGSTSGTCGSPGGPPRTTASSAAPSASPGREEEKVGVSAVRVPSRATRFTDQTLTCSYNLATWASMLSSGTSTTANSSGGWKT
nr:uncharacterized protein LOC113825499 [Penaeus vannamei]